MTKRIFPAILLCMTGGFVHAETYDFKYVLKGLMSAADMEPPAAASSAAACGAKFCYLLIDGRVWFSGHGDFGQSSFGLDYKTNKFEPTSFDGVSAIYAGTGNGYAIKNGELFSIGSVAYGALGRPGAMDSWASTGLTNVTMVAGGSGSAFAVSNGELYAAGRNNAGQLGTGDTANLSSFTKIQVPEGVINAIALGSATGYVVVDGRLHSVGSNSDGQLGIGQNGGSALEWVYTGQDDVIDVSAKLSHVYARRMDSLVAGGDNRLYQTAPSLSSSFFTRPIQTYSSFTNEVFASNFGALAITSEGRLIAQGHGGYHGLGLDIYSGRTSWKQLSVPSPREISGDGDSTIIVASDGVYVTGNGENGELGTGAYGVQAAFVKLPESDFVFEN